MLTTARLLEVFDQLAREGASDGELLTRFLKGRDSSALAELVRRHGPMVWGVCRRLLPSPQDAEDAFQATFLVLLRRADSVQPPERVGNWLHGVAQRTALKARALAAKRAQREHPRSDLSEVAVAPEVASTELGVVLDQEVSRLPDRYRVVVVLCDLEGKTRKEAAQQLGWPEGTVAGRLARARALLAKRLLRRGVAVSAGAMALFSTSTASASIPPAVLGVTLQGIRELATSHRALPEAFSAHAVALAEGVIHAMVLSKFKSLGAIVVLLGMLAAASHFGAQVVHNPVQAGEPAPVQPALPHAAQPPAPPPKQTSEAKIEQLLKRRLDLLTQMEEVAQMRFKNGTMTMHEVQKISLRRSNAELELCKTDKERVAVLEKIVNLCKQMEERVHQLRMAARVSATEVQETQLQRLDAEIALERARAKLAPSK